MAKQSVALDALDRGELADAARERLSEVLGQEVREPDEDGIVEIQVEADSREEAIEEALDAIGSAGADDHFAIAEHQL
jgi:hypothetical protein